MLIIKVKHTDGTRRERLISGDSRYLLQCHYNIDDQRMSLADYDGNTEIIYYMTINQWHKVRDWFENGYSVTVSAYTYPMDQVTTQHKVTCEDNNNPTFRSIPLPSYPMRRTDQPIEFEDDDDLFD